MTIAHMRVTSLDQTNLSSLGSLTKASRAPIYTACALLAAYTCVPLGVAAVLDTDGYYVELAEISALAAIGVWLGSHIRMFDPLFRGDMPRIKVPAATLNGVLWIVFVLFVLVAWTTAERIPLLAAIGGADPDVIAVLREQFLKGREGWQASFVYINAILSGALIPYSIAMMFLHRMRLRWLAFAFFLVFCVSFVEKAFFLKATLPLFYLVAQRRIRVPLSPSVLVLGMLSLLMVVTVFSGAGAGESAADEAFFSTGYAPQGPVAHIVWRSVAIPVITAADAVRVLHENFNGQLLWGRTSSLIAGLTGMDHVEFERQVFAAEWGQSETGTGSSNSVYITEAYVNFGLPGIVIFSLIVGLLMRFFATSRDEAFRSLWPLFAMGIFTSGLIGLLFSNGFLMLFALGLFVRFTNLSHPREATFADTATPATAPLPPKP